MKPGDYAEVMRELSAAGLDPEQIAGILTADLGFPFDRQQVRYHLSRLGVPMDDRIMTFPTVPKTRRNGTHCRSVEDREQAETMYRAGTPLNEIAATMHTSPTTLRKWRKLYGWPMRYQTSNAPRKHSDPHPLVWRCPCDPRQLHKAGEPCQCGHVPPWAEAS